MHGQTTPDHSDGAGHWADALDAGLTTALVLVDLCCGEVQAVLRAPKRLSEPAEGEGPKRRRTN